MQPYRRYANLKFWNEQKEICEILYIACFVYETVQ